MLADFCGVNTPTMADWLHVGSLSESETRFTMDSWEQAAEHIIAQNLAPTHAMKKLIFQYSSKYQILTRSLG